MVASCHVGADLHGHWHGIFIQSSINVGKSVVSLNALHMKNCTDLNLDKGLIITSCHFPDKWFWFLFLIVWQWKPAIPSSYCMLIRVPVEKWKFCFDTLIIRSSVNASLSTKIICKKIWVFLGILFWCAFYILSVSFQSFLLYHLVIASPKLSRNYCLFGAILNFFHPSFPTKTSSFPCLKLHHFLELPWEIFSGVITDN